jgi:hypothetical protein
MNVRQQLADESVSKSMHQNVSSETFAIAFAHIRMNLVSIIVMTDDKMTVSSTSSLFLELPSVNIQSKQHQLQTEARKFL